MLWSLTGLALMAICGAPLWVLILVGLMMGRAPPKERHGGAANRTGAANSDRARQKGQDS